MPLPTPAAPLGARLASFLLPAAAVGLTFALAGCVDNGRATTDEPVCSPLVKFAMPAGVSPQAANGVVLLPVDVSDCALDAHAVWAWSGAGDLDIALDVYPAEDSGSDLVVAVPVQESIDADCDATSITVALVDDRGDIVDQDRTFVPYRLGGS
ncbi:MAG: hypothetical protein H6742_02315 [Alphaproteobacteria bacterium]|nr:hypothetical protein [Alphaproteobacteria bacterium]